MRYGIRYVMQRTLTDDMTAENQMNSHQIRSSGTEHLNEHAAKEWVRNMQNDDGTVGEHWTMDQVKQLMKQKDLKCDPAEFYAILNAVYSDYCKVARKHGVNTMDFYIDMTKAWLDDKDAVPDKAAAYYEYIVVH